MESQNIIMDELIAKYLSGEASAAEKETLHSWISFSDANKKYFSEVESVYEATGEILNRPAVDVDAAWNNFRGKLSARKEHQPVLKKIAFPFYAKAAAILLLAGIGSLIYYASAGSEKEIILAASDSPVSDTLPDGTFVTLDPQSTITYLPSFNRENRELKLAGGAYFHVQHGPQLPFIVNASGVFIKDIGTAFTIKANLADSIVSVNVEEGEVAFYSTRNAGIALTEREAGIYNKTLLTFRKMVAPGSGDAPGRKTLKFENASLHAVTDSLNSIYHAHIVLSCSIIADLKLTATFNEETVDPIVETIAETFGLSVIRTPGTILLDGDVCKR